MMQQSYDNDDEEDASFKEAVRLYIAYHWRKIEARRLKFNDDLARAMQRRGLSGA